MAEIMSKDQQLAGLRERVLSLDKMLKDSAAALSEKSPTFGSSPQLHPMIENLESELKIQKITNGDLVEEANDYVRDNIQLKDEMAELKLKMASASAGAQLDVFKARLVDDFKAELTIERKSHLKALSEKDTKIWTLQKNQDDRRMELIGKDGKISRLESQIRMLEQNTESSIAMLPFSAGMMTEEDCQRTVGSLRAELENEKLEHAITKAYYRQVDSAYNLEAEELSSAIYEAEELATMLRHSQST